jgi:hypothetical protein
MGSYKIAVLIENALLLDQNLIGALYTYWSEMTNLKDDGASN